MNSNGIWTDKLRLGGTPCIRWHRFSLAQLLAEVADGSTLKQIVEDFDIDYDYIREAWCDLVQQLALLKINSQYIMSDRGENCIKGHRIPISLILMTLLQQNWTPKEVAYNWDLTSEQVEGVLWNLATLLDRSWVNGPPQDIERVIAEGVT